MCSLHEKMFGVQLLDPFIGAGRIHVRCQNTVFVMRPRSCHVIRAYTAVGTNRTVRTGDSDRS
jgi:hypothetical protein